MQNYYDLDTGTDSVLIQDGNNESCFDGPHGVSLSSVKNRWLPEVTQSSIAQSLAQSLRAGSSHSYISSFYHRDTESMLIALKRIA